MAEIRVERLHKAFQNFVAVQNSSFVDRGSLLLRHARALGLRQDDDAAHDRGPRAADRRQDSARTARMSRFSRAAERDIAFVFQLFALYPHMNVRAEHRVSAEMRGRRSRRDPQAGPRGRAVAAHRASSRPARSRGSLAATANASPLAAPSCAGRRPFSWTSRSARSTPSFADIMCDELRDLHDRIGATTVYVTHDQLEAMSMADRIAGHEPRRGRAGRPRRRRSTTGRTACSSPTSSARRSMNFIRFEGKLQRGDRAVRLQRRRHRRARNA